MERKVYLGANLSYNQFVGKRILLRLLSILLTLFIVSLALYSLEYFSLGDSLSVIMSEEASDADLSRYRNAHSDSVGFISGYIKYISSFFSFNWGVTASGLDVKEVIASRLPLTLTLAISSIFFSLLFSFLWSIAAVIKRGNLDKTAEIFSIVAMSLPSFLIAIILVIVFSVLLKIFPVAGYIDPSLSVGGYLKSIFLPTLSLTIINAPIWLRIFKGELKKIASESYCTSIIMQGGDNKDIVLYSALKPSLIFALSLFADSFASALAGSAVVEKVFALPGLGSLMVSAALSRDVQLAGVTMLLIALMVSVVFVVAEVLQALLDPRVRRSYEKA